MQLQRHVHMISHHCFDDNPGKKEWSDDSRTLSLGRVYQVNKKDQTVSGINVSKGSKAIRINN